MAGEAGRGDAGDLVGVGRTPTWVERENNKRRERRRRAVAAKIYAGLRAHGGYRLPKHCDNNEVLKALCREAGWIVEPDCTTYRKGCKPTDCMDIRGGSAPLSSCSSYQLSPCTFYNPSPTSSYNPSPPSSTLQSPASSSYVTYASNTPPADGAAKVTSLVPCLKNISSTATSSTSSKLPLRHLCIHGGSISAPVTPPLSSPTARSPRSKNHWDAMATPPSWSENYMFLPSSSTPPSPGPQSVPDSGWLSAVQSANGGPSSPTFSLINPFAFLKEAVATGGSLRLWTPGQSGTCSPVMQGGVEQADMRISDGASDEFAFGSCNSNDNQPEIDMVKPWEGERIHEECVSDELQLTLGSSRTRTDAC